MPRPTPALPFLPTLVISFALASLSTPAASARADALDFREQSLELPGAPAALVPADLDGDGLRDLAVVVVYTGWDQIGIEEMTEMDQVEGLVEVLTIVPVLLDRREVRAYLGRPGGGYEPTGEAIPLPLSVLTLEPGPPGAPAVALTDEGVSALVFDRGASADGSGGTLRFEPVIESPPVLAGAGTFLAGLDLVADVTGDGVLDLLLPAPEGLAVHRGTATGLEPVAVAVGPRPGDGAALDSRVVDYPLPRFADLDGDRLPDLLFRTPGGGRGHRFVARNLGGGRFGAPVALDPREEREPAEDAEGEDEEDGEGGHELVFVGRMQPSGPATAVSVESLGEEDAGLREEMRQAREPDHRLHFRPLDRAGASTGLAIDTERAERPPQQVTGYVPGDWSGGDGGDDETGDFTLPGGFQDLNGDGRTDLVTVTNDISLMKAMALLATRRLTLDLGFHPWCQTPEGRLVRAPGPPLESRLSIDLDDIELRRRSLFAGDFDADGRADFLQLGRPKRIGVHRGRADCSYPERPDATIVLRDPIRDLALVEVIDLDGDGRADLAVTHPQAVDERGVTPPVRLDLYLSGGAR